VKELSRTLLEICWVLLQLVLLEQRQYLDRKVDIVLKAEEPDLHGVRGPANVRDLLLVHVSWPNGVWVQLLWPLRLAWLPGATAKRTIHAEAGPELDDTLSAMMDVINLPIIPTKELPKLVRELLQLLLLFSMNGTSPKIEMESHEAVVVFETASPLHWQLLVLLEQAKSTKIEKPRTWKMRET
jgi:hypothetical protein